MTSCGMVCATGSCGQAATQSFAADAHGWHAVAVFSGGIITETLSVRGPLTVEGGCRASLRLWIIGSDGRTAEPSESPTPNAGVSCSAISLQSIAAGATADFAASIQVPAIALHAATLHGQLLISGQGDDPGGNAPVITFP